MPSVNLAPCLWFEDEAGEAADVSVGVSPGPGSSWQVIPRGLNELLASSEYDRSERAMRAVLRMDKLDLGLIRRAWRGEPVPFVSSGSLRSPDLESR